MTDIVVTVSSDRWRQWIDLSPLGEEEYGCSIGGRYLPSIRPGERVYAVVHGQLRGYAPLAYLDLESPERFGLLSARRLPKAALGLRGVAVGVTIDERITGFRNWRYRWWERWKETPFPMVREP